jgi:hypothetical protein
MVSKGKLSDRRFLLWWVGGLTLLYSAGFVVLTLQAGQDANWDLYNHHFYNPHSFLNDRFWFDIAPAQRQNFFSPFLDIPFYWLTVTFDIATASAAYAVVQSWHAPAFFLLSFILFSDFGIKRINAAVISFALTALAAFSPYNLMLVGATTGDNTTATLVLWGLVCLCLVYSRTIAVHPGYTWRLLVLAGLLTGAAVGLKLTNGPFAVALAICVLPLGQEARYKLQNLVIVSLSVLAGFILSYGYWGWFLYDQFQNPFFPLFNHLFQSEFMKPVELNDETFMAPTVLGKIFYPFFYNAYTGAINHQQFLDLRLPVLYVLSAWAATSLLVFRSARHRWSENGVCAVLLLYCIVAYPLWLLLFSITRYLNVLEILAPLAAIAAICIISSRRAWSLGLAIAAVATIGVSTIDAASRNQVFGPRAAWTDTPFDVQMPNLALEGSMVLISSGQAMSFIIPGLPENTRFVRIDSNLHYVGYTSREERYGNTMGQKLKNAIGAHTGDFYIIFSQGEEIYTDLDLEFFGFRREVESCSTIDSKGPSLTICPAVRTAENDG